MTPISYRRQLERQRQRIVSSRRKIADLDRKKSGIDGAIDEINQAIALSEKAIVALEARLAKRERDGLLRSRTAPGELSSKRHIRIRQVLNKICDDFGLQPPKWVKTISDSDVRYVPRDRLIEKYVIADSGVGASLDAEARFRLATAFRDLFKADTDVSVKPDDLFAIHPAFKLERALEIAVAGRAEFGVADERGLIVTKRNLMARTAICRCTVVGDWLEDSASRLAARLRPDGGRNIPDGSETGKLAAAIEVSVNRDKVRSLAHQENDARLMDAIALFATPGALAAACRRGLSAKQRAFCAQWFAENRDLATRLGYRVGTEALFAELEKDPEPFRARYGAAPKFAPATSRIWAREKKEDVNFEGVQPKELIGEARHALVDLTLHSHLVSMPKRRDNFVDLGAYEGAEALHGESVDVAGLLTKAFLTEARDAAEVQIMQGTNPLAMTAGLVTWRSADGVERQAPLFLAPVELNEATKTISRLSEFVLNWALLRRIAIEFPMLAGSKDDFDALLGDIAFASPLGAVFERVAAAINVGAPVGGKPIIRIDDVSLVGSFDSARSVLERRLNLSAFPDLVDNPVVKLLALGAKAADKERIVEGEFDAQGARSRSDKIQALAVKASLGGTSFVLEGPPGTGKTQTIAAMVEALAKQRKRVLVSAAMPGAIEVIGRRLAGLVNFGICSVRPGQINIGPTKKVDPRVKRLGVVIGTPVALTKELPADDRFDVLIIDEASQLRLSHALALCGHASQIIVAGDSRQLQPRDSEVGVVSESSLLARARLAGLPVVMLERHYRSQHPSLIAWSDAFSYDSKLKPNLGPFLLGDAGYEVVYLGATRRLTAGEAQVNVEEAEAIAAECLKWARDGRRTVGVAALTQGQRDLIRETVEKELGEARLSGAMPKFG